MAKGGFVLGTTAALAAAVAVVGFQLANPSIAAFRDSPKEIVDEAWQIINREYVDGSFNKQDWRQVRRQYVENRDYSSKAEAYRSVKEMLKLLDDPYTRFMDPEQFANMQIDTSGDLVGVGLQLGMDETTKQLTVISPIEDTPASRAGLLSKDIIVSISDKTTDGMDINQAVALIRGTEGTKVKLGIKRGDRQFDVDLTRAKVELHAVKTELRDTNLGKISYISLRQFNAKAAEDMRKAIQDHLGKGAVGFVLDLRGNPGGLLFSSVEIAKMWLDNATIVSTVDRKGEKFKEVANRQSITDKPLVVLVDSGSASASEILAGALQDNKRAVIVGTKTFGKGLVQSVHSMSDGSMRDVSGKTNGSGMTVTIAKYYTPSGRDINHMGIVPDRVIELSKEDIERLNKNRDLVGTISDPQFAKAIEILSGQLKK